MNEIPVPAIAAIAPPSVLLIDDDRELLDMLGDYLAGEGFRVSRAHDGPGGIEQMLRDHHDIAVLDVMMAGMDGFRVLKAIRALSALPVIILSGRGDDDDRITGLELGADDYVGKPCTPRELTARVRAILKRTSTLPAPEPANQRQAMHVGTLTIWPSLRRAEDEGTELVLTSTEFNLLEVLARNAGQAVSKTALSNLALGRPLSRYDRSIDVHIHAIRQKLRPLQDGRSRIQTIFRQGYLLTGSCECE